jgi:hypothetical protein
MHALSSHVSFAPTVSEIVDVQDMRADVSHGSDVLRATAWINPHTAEGSCVKVRTLLDRHSDLFPSPFVGFCERRDNAPISEYVDLGKIIPAMRGQRSSLAWLLVTSRN